MDIVERHGTTYGKVLVHDLTSFEVTVVEMYDAARLIPVKLRVRLCRCQGFCQNIMLTR